MTLIYDSNVATKLSLGPTQYIIGQLCASYAPMLKSTKSLHDVLNVDSAIVTKAIRHLVDVGLLELSANGSYYPTPKWYLAHDGEEIEVVSTKDREAIEVIEYFNQVNGTKYQIPNNAELVARLMKSNSKLTVDHFRSVILHKSQTWGVDDKMKEYNRPSTLFSGKFMKYLDEANHYWLIKMKEHA